MKKFVFLCFFVFTTTSFFAQDEGLKYVYCQLEDGLKIKVSYGDLNELINDDVFLDENGKAIPFKTVIDGLNYMGAKGWELVQTYVMPYGSSSISYWVLRKPITMFPKEQQDEIVTWLQEGPFPAKIRTVRKDSGKK